MEFLEVLTEGLERVLLVRGGGREVITIYSWANIGEWSQEMSANQSRFHCWRRGRNLFVFVFFVFVKNGLLNAKEVYSILVEYWDTLV